MALKAKSFALALKLRSLALRVRSLAQGFGCSQNFGIVAKCLLPSLHMPVFEYAHEAEPVSSREATMMTTTTLMTMPATDRPIDAWPRRRAPVGSDTDVLLATSASSYRPHTAHPSQRNAVTFAAARTHTPYETRYEMIFNVRSKVDISQLNLPLGTNN